MCETLSQLLNKNKSFTKAQLDMCIAFMWQGFGSGDGAEVASVGRHQGLPPCQSQFQLPPKWTHH